MEAPKTVIKEGKVHSDLSLEIIESLKRILCWYEAMIDTKSGRFIYEYDVTNHVSIMENCPIREMGSVWDISELLHFAKFHNINLRSESFPASKQFHSFRLEDKIQEWIQHYVSMVSPFRSFKQQNVQAAHINSAKIQEPASIAHNAFLILCLLTDETSRRSYLEIARMLAEGIIAQQRTDGSYKVYFSDVKDSGVELYAGESMLALMRFHHLTQDPDCLRSVEAALPYYQDFYYDGNIPESSTVFFFNWMAPISQTSLLPHSRQLYQRIHY